MKKGKRRLDLAKLDLKLILRNASKKAFEFGLITKRRMKQELKTIEQAKS